MALARHSLPHPLVVHFTNTWGVAYPRHEGHRCIGRSEGEGAEPYIPVSGTVGSDSFTYKVSDGSLTYTATVYITITNSAPVAAGDTYQISHDQPLYIPAAGVLQNDTDGDYDFLTAVLVNGPSYGTLTLNADGSFLYEPEASYVGADGFQYQADDGAESSATVTVTIEVLNTAPVGVDDSFSVAQNVTLEVPAPGLLVNDYEPDGDSFTISLDTSPAHGTATINSDGSCSYEPDLDYIGSDSFTYVLSDGSLTSEPVTVWVTVKENNEGPTGVADEYETPHDSPLEVPGSAGVLANDTDADFDTLLAQVDSGPGHGTLTLWLDGGFLYSPDEGFSGTDSFTYCASDGTVWTSPLTVTITVSNVAPQASGETYSVLASGETIIDPGLGVLLNDVDPDDPLTAELVSGPAHGTLTLAADGGFSYTPDGSFSSADSFTYRAVNSTQNSSPATVTLLSGPVAWDDGYTVLHDGTLEVSAEIGVLWNDLDADGDPLTAVLVSGPTNGTLTLNSDGSFTYTPDSAFIGTDSFVYEVSNGTSTGTSATVTIQVTNQDPIASEDAYLVAKNGSLTVSATAGVLSTDYDPDGDSITAELVTGPSHGTLTLNSDGSFTYTPDTDYEGSDEFEYQISDGYNDSESVIVTLTIQPVLVVGSGSGPRAVAAGDVDNDGNLDVVVAYYDAGTISVLLGNGDGTFNTVSPWSVGDTPRAIKLGDLDGDGHLDLAVAHETLAQVTIHLGDGAGGFTLESTLTVGTGPVALEVVDLNGDSNLDLLVANRDSGTVSILLGDGTGGFTLSGALEVADEPVALAVGDFNEDGNPDLAMVRHGAAVLALFLGAGDGTFAEPLHLPTGASPAAVGVGDFTGDGHLDLVVSNRGAFSVWVLPGNGDGTFQEHDSYDVGYEPESLTVGDFNGDGRPDVTVACNGSSEAIVLASHAIGIMYEEVRQAVAGAFATVMGDFNADGFWDGLVTSLVLGNVVLVQGAASGITVSGRITYDTAPGATKPVRRALVEITAPAEFLLLGLIVPGWQSYQTWTDDNGYYSVALSPNVVTRVDVSVHTMTKPAGVGQNQTRAAVHFGGLWTYNQAISRNLNPLEPNERVIGNIAIGNATINDKAFWTFDAFITASKLHETLGLAPSTTYGRYMSSTGTQPSQADSNYVYIREDGWDYWDGIIHEYGHVIQYLGGFKGPATGLRHDLEPNQRNYNPTAGFLLQNKEAFREGFPHFYSMVAQELDPGTPKDNLTVRASISPVPFAAGFFSGDEKYRWATRNLGYPRQRKEGATGESSGEDGELSVLRVLWDFFDPVTVEDAYDDFGMDQVALSFRAIYDLIAPGPGKGAAYTLHDFGGYAMESLGNALERRYQEYATIF